MAGTCRCGCGGVPRAGEWLRGHNMRHCSAATRAKLAAHMRRRLDEAEHFPFGRPSKYEERVAEELRRRDIPFEAQRRIPGTQFFPDFLLPGRVIIEVYGAWWHASHDRQLYDSARNERLRQLGYTVLVLDDLDFKNDVLSAAIDDLLDELELPCAP